MKNVTLVNGMAILIGFAVGFVLPIISDAADTKNALANPHFDKQEEGSDPPAPISWCFSGVGTKESKTVSRT